MSTFDWTIGVLFTLGFGYIFWRGVIEAHRQHRANRDRERTALRKAAEREGR